jgi:branched-chain amino acid transport system ATP-binding protein
VSTALLKVAGLEKRFGGIVALDDFAVEIRPGELLGLIGPNGAGKTTVFNLLSGVLAPTRGRIAFDGRDVTALPPHRRAALGLARTFQNIRLFGELSVLDNIKAALHRPFGRGFWSTIAHTPGFRRAEGRIEARAREVLARLGLEALAGEAARNLPYGLQRRVELGRAIAPQPRLILLDEPAAGLNPTETEELIGLIRRIHRDHGMAVLLVEHHMPVVMSLCERILVLDRGRTIARGTPAEIRGDARVIAAYLGRPKEARAC